MLNAGPFCVLSFLYFSKNTIIHFYTSKYVMNIKEIFIYNLKW